MEGDPIYRPSMQQRSGEEIRLSTLWMHHRDACENTVKTVEEFLAIWVTG